MSAIPQGLIDAIANRQIVPFVGAGLSMTLGGNLFPSWPALIERFASRLEKEGLNDAAATVRAAAAANKLVEAAEHAVAQLHKPFFLDEMRHAFDRRLPPGANLTAVGAVWRMQPRLVITTNFERVLEWPLGLPDAVPYQPPQQAPILVHSTDPALLEEIDHPPDQRPRLWHLHGSVARPDTIILTTSQFERLYGAPGGAPIAEYAFAINRLQNLLATRPLFFLGFSLGDPYVLRHISDVLALTANNSPVSYLFVKRGEKKPAELQDHQIQLVEFDDFGEPMVARLNEVVAAGRPELASADETDVPPGLQPIVRQLGESLTGLYPDPAVVAAAYNRSCPEAWARFPNLGDGVLLLRTAIERLARAPVQHGSGGGWPLIAFAARLRESAPGHADSLSTWIDAAIDVVGSNDQERERIRLSLDVADGDVPAAPPYALVRILELDAERWGVQAWLFEKGPASVPEPLFSDEREYDPSRCSDLVRDLMLELLGKQFDPARSVIAFLLPRTLLWEKVEAWRAEPEPSFEPMLGTSVAVTVRPQRNALQQQYVRRFWETLRDNADQDLQLIELAQLAGAAGGRAVWLRPDDPAAAGTVRRLRESEVTCAVIAAAPPAPAAPSPLFDVVLAAGVPVVLWVRDASGAGGSLEPADVAQLIGAPILDLPGRLRRLRADEDDQGVTGLGSRIGLIWDAAEYVPPDLDPDNRAIV